MAQRYHQYLTVRQVAQQVQLSEQTVRDHAVAGRLKGRRPQARQGSKWRFLQADVDCWLSNGEENEEAEASS